MGHDRREKHEPRHPALLTLRADRGVPSLRSIALFRAIRDVIARTDDAAFRILHFSVQQDHVHAIVEADSHDALSRGIRSFVIRIAFAIRRVARVRKVWGDRYHARALTTPREVRHAIAYTLLNFRKHLRAPAGIDPCSSGPWFSGWLQPARPPSLPSPTATPRTWLAAVGWRRGGGPIHTHEEPGPARKFSR